MYEIGRIRQAGVTLVEIMVTVVVLGVLAAIAIPGFDAYSSTSARRAAVSDFLSAAGLARSMAIQRGQDVTLCPRNGNQCSAAADWSNGWLMVTGGQVMRSWGETPSGVQQMSADSGGAITWSSTGMVSAARNIELIMIDGAQRCIRITTLGRVSTETGACP
ncbi:hypothetical protein CFI10_13790 [Marinobacterium iners]|jgi:type IV fimbrial biogenesis protein FimT|uniref:GspH/FimT family pseudopilin n=1 Tax=Marinobacterium TaxID=48075 RepID=UPI001A8E9C09|nr:GspH/FimT family pseudopilin [Marinobacterium iners]QSR36053.1 hypothetical protein CFI10_13790 [Marinobacterium iners]